LVPDDSTFREVHQQPRLDGHDQKCGKPGSCDSSVGNLMVKYKLMPQVQKQLEVTMKGVA